MQSKYKFISVILVSVLFIGMIVAIISLATAMRHYKQLADIRNGQDKLDKTLDSLNIVYATLEFKYKQDSIRVKQLTGKLALQDSVIRVKTYIVEDMQSSYKQLKRRHNDLRKKIIERIDTDTGYIDSLRRKHFLHL